MSDHSSIEWTDATWNPVRGCTKISPGCTHCYAETFAERFRGVPGHPYEQGFDLRLIPGKLAEPLKWQAPKMIFVNSMSDLFHELVPDEFIGRVFDTMARADHHTYQILTKRPERMRDWFRGEVGRAWAIDPLRNVWLGTSIELDRWVARADALRETPAAVRFISAEPLLGPLVSLNLVGIDWLIVGGESGSSHRPMKIEWVRELLDKARDADTAFFFKQWGGRTPKAGGRDLDGHTYDEYPFARSLVT